MDQWQNGSGPRHHSDANQQHCCTGSDFGRVNANYHSSGKKVFKLDMRHTIPPTQFII